MLFLRDIGRGYRKKGIFNAFESGFFCGVGWIGWIALDRLISRDCALIPALLLFVGEHIKSETILYTISNRVDVIFDEFV